MREFVSVCLEVAGKIICLFAAGTVDSSNTTDDTRPCDCHICLKNVTGLVLSELGLPYAMRRGKCSHRWFNTSLLSMFQTPALLYSGVYVLWKKAAVVSKGTLFMDGCDFSECRATLLVDVDGQAPTPVIRNAVLGYSNCE